MSRNPDLLANSAAASSPATLPALPPVKEGDWGSLMRWVQAMTERSEVREGHRRNKMEQVLTRRDVQDLPAMFRTVTAGTATGLVAMRDSQGGTVMVRWSDLEASIRQSQLYRDLVRSIDDPTRFDRFGEKVKALLLPSLAEEAAKLGANIRRTEGATQSDDESFAFQQTQITAAISKAMAGVRTTLWAQVMRDNSIAGYALQITARLDGFDGGVATIEEVATAIADRTTGLEAQWTLKVSAGGAIAGIGVAATDPLDGNATSAIILMADKVAIVDPSYSGGPDLTPGTSDLPFLVSGGVVYLRKAFIKDADIDTLKIAGNAVTVPVAYTTAPGQNSDASTTYTYSFTVTMPEDGVLFASAMLAQAYTGAVPGWQASLDVDGVLIADTGTVLSAFQQAVPLAGAIGVLAGTRTVTVSWWANNVSATLGTITAYAVSAMR